MSCSPAWWERSEDTGHTDSHETQTTESAHLHAHMHVLVEATRQGIHERYMWTCARTGEQAEGHICQGYRCMQTGAFTDGHTHAQHTRSCTQIPAHRRLGQGNVLIYVRMLHPFKATFLLLPFTCIPLTLPHHSQAAFCTH